MFCGVRFKCRFLLDFGSLLKPFEAPFGTTFEEQTLPKIASNKRDPKMKIPDYPMSDGSQRRRLACALLEQQQ